MEDEVNDVDTDEIFQRFINNRSRGFKRTSPATDSVPNNQNQQKAFNCETCGYQAEGKSQLNDHITRVHKITRRAENRTQVPRSQSPQTKAPQSQVNNSKEQRRPLYCHFWNNYGSCHFEGKNGRPCKFEHKTAPKCNFDGRCNRNACMFTHQKQNMDFLGDSNRGVRPPPPPPQPWQILMEALGFPRMNGQEQSRRGNQRRQ